MDEQTGSRKRPRKVYRACVQCTTAKARCEDVYGTGCARCRHRKEHCSLIGVQIAETTEPLVSPDKVEELCKRVRILEETIVNISKQQEMSETSKESTERPVYQAGYPIEPRQLDLSSFRKAIAGGPSAAVFGEPGFSVTDPRGYPNIVTRRLLPQNQVDMAFQVFKHRFSSTLPFAPFLLATTPTPTHPFLVLAILAHVPETCPPNLGILVDESVLYSMTGVISTDVMLALMVLSLAPFHSSSASHTPATPFRLISLAYQFGKSLGLEKREKYLVDGHSEAATPDVATAVHDLLLWESVKHMYTLNMIIFSRDDAFPILRNHKLHPSTADHLIQTSRFLQSQAAIFCAVRPLATLLAELETKVSSESLPFDRAFDSWSKAWAEVEDLVLKHVEQDITARCLMLALALRTSMLIQCADLQPSSRYHNPQAAAAENCLTSGNVLIRLFLALSPKPIPAHVMSSVVVALSLLRRTVVMLQKVGVDPRKVVDVSSLEMAELLVAGHAGLPGRLVREMWGDLDGDGSNDPQSLEFDWPLLETFYQALASSRSEM